MCCFYDFVSFSYCFIVACSVFLGKRVKRELKTYNLCVDFQSLKDYGFIKDFINFLN